MTLNMRLLYKTIKRSQQTRVSQFVHSYIKISTNTGVIGTSFLEGSGRYIVLCVEIGRTAVIGFGLMVKGFSTVATDEEISFINSSYQLPFSKKLTSLYGKILYRTTYTKGQLCHPYRFGNKCITASYITRECNDTCHLYDRPSPFKLLLLAARDKQGRQTHHKKYIFKIKKLLHISFILRFTNTPQSSRRKLHHSEKSFPNGEL